MACLLLFSMILLSQKVAVHFLSDSSYTKWGCLIIAIIFFIRAVGDFNYLGFFKKHTGSQFSKYDTRLSSPLCLFLGLLALLAWLT